MFQVFISDEARDFVLRLPSEAQQKIKGIFRDLQLYPDTKHLHMKKLTGMDVFRIRIGNYRMLCEIDGKTQRVDINKIDDCKEAYR